MTNRTPAQLKTHYRDYQGTPEQIAKRSARNKARRLMAKKLGKAAIKGKDVDHKKPLRDGGSNNPKSLSQNSRCPITCSGRAPGDREFCEEL